MHSIHYGQGNKNQQQQQQKIPQNELKPADKSVLQPYCQPGVMKRHRSFLGMSSLTYQSFEGEVQISFHHSYILCPLKLRTKCFFLLGRGRWCCVKKNLTLFQLTRKTNKNQAIFLKDLFNVRPKYIYTHIHIP